MIQEDIFKARAKDDHKTCAALGACVADLEVVPAAKPQTPYLTCGSDSLKAYRLVKKLGVELITEPAQALQYPLACLNAVGPKPDEQGH